MSSEAQQIVKVRLEGEREDIREVPRQLRRDFWVLDQSREYPNRKIPGSLRCYVNLYPRVRDLPVHREGQE